MKSIPPTVPIHVPFFGPPPLTNSHKCYIKRTRKPHHPLIYQIYLPYLDNIIIIRGPAINLLKHVHNCRSFGEMTAVARNLQIYDLTPALLAVERVDTYRA